MNAERSSRIDRRLSFAAFWLLSFVVMLGAQHDPSDAIRILDGRAAATLQSDAVWTVPAVAWPTSNRFADWTYGSCALVVPLIIALVGQRMLHNHHRLGVVSLTVWSLTLAVQLEHVSAAIVVVASIWLTDSILPTRFRLLGCSVGVAVALLVTAEWGLIGMLSLSVLVPRTWRQSRQTSRVLFLASLCVLGVCVAVVPGLGVSLLRPVRWIGLRPPVEVLDETLAMFGESQSWLSHAPLATLMVVAVVVAAWNREHRRVAMGLALLVSIGLACVHYLWLLGVMLASWIATPKTAQLKTAQLWDRVGLVVLAVASFWSLARLPEQLPAYTQFVMAGATAQRTQPELWGVEGRVLLLDLDHSGDWQNEPT